MRIGGDEFVMLLSNIGPAGVRAYIGRVRAHFDAAMRRAVIPIGGSIGVVSSAVPDRPEGLLVEADAQMCEVRRQGKGAGLPASRRPLSGILTGEFRTECAELRAWGVAFAAIAVGTTFADKSA